MVNGGRVPEKIDFQKFREMVKKKLKKAVVTIKKSGIQLFGKIKLMRAGSLGCEKQFAILGIAQGQV